MENSEVTEEEVTEVTKARESDYLWIKGKFNYGGRNKTYGLLSCILDLTEENMTGLDLLVTDEGIDIQLGVSLDQFIEVINNSITDYRSSKSKEKLVSSLTTAEIDQLLTAEERLEAATEIFKEKLETIIQETIKINLELESITESEVKEKYPDLFTTEEPAEEEEQLEEAEEKEVEPEDDGLLNAKLVLKCSPVISAVRGKKITNLQLQDRVVVQVVDNRSVGQDIADLLQQERGQVTGVLEGIEYNQELDRYKISVRFKQNIYGKLVVDPEVKLAIPEEDMVTKQEDTSSGFDLDQEVFILFGVLGIIALLIILIFVFL
ncbi:hypothetical protein [Halanaerobaculum tunisiense]